MGFFSKKASHNTPRPEDSISLRVRPKGSRRSRRSSLSAPAPLEIRKRRCSAPSAGTYYDNVGGGSDGGGSAAAARHNGGDGGGSEEGPAAGGKAPLTPFSGVGGALANGGSGKLAAGRGRSGSLSAGGSGGSEPLPAGWRMRRTVDGVPYYANVLTKTTSWKRPDLTVGGAAAGGGATREHPLRSGGVQLRPSRRSSKSSSGRPKHATKMASPIDSPEFETLRRKHLNPDKQRISAPKSMPSPLRDPASSKASRSKETRKRPGFLPMNDINDVRDFADVHCDTETEIPIEMLTQFERLSNANTRNSLETGGVIYGKNVDGVYRADLLYIGPQSATGQSFEFNDDSQVTELDSCVANGSEIMIASIHTHPPPFEVFMSDRDTHMQLGLQKQGAHVVSIVVAPTGSQPLDFGVYTLTEEGMRVVDACSRKGAVCGGHPKPPPSLYATATHVHFKKGREFVVVDRRC